MYLCKNEAVSSHKQASWIRKWLNRNSRDQ